MLSFMIVGLALTPAAALAFEKNRTEPVKSRVTDSLAWIAAVGVAGAYWCAIAGLKAWSAIRPQRTAD